MLVKSGLKPAAMLEGVLSALEGCKRTRGVELGYMLSINVYDLFSKKEDWVFDPEKLQFFSGFHSRRGPSGCG
jgi:hypothetical protein